MKTYTDEQLKRVLAKMLPEHLRIQLRGSFNRGSKEVLLWNDNREVLDTELLAICHMLKLSLADWQRQECINNIYRQKLADTHPDFDANWQTQTIALAKTLNIEIV